MFFVKYVTYTKTVNDDNDNNKLQETYQEMR